MRSIIDTNYSSILNRGLINDKTSSKDDENFREELADVILVCFNISKHYGWDIESELFKKVAINEKRANKN
tara:strand:+ start:473 stop:685 length:213 start_codon:yes stop_codon:yes gene_type:complete